MAVTGQNLLSELRPKRPPIWVYGAPLVLEVRLGAGLFLPYCLSSQRTGTGPAGRARVPTTPPTTPGSPHGLGGWLDGPGCTPRRRRHAATGVKPPDRCFNPGGIYPLNFNTSRTHQYQPRIENGFIEPISGPHMPSGTPWDSVVASVAPWATGGARGPPFSSPRG